MKCSNCNEDIQEEDQIVEAVVSSTNRQHKKFCHLRCFRCSICHQTLIGWDFEKDGILYCAQDYYDKFGERCRQCQHFMTGPVMIIGGRYKFHPECFKCECCNGIIGDDESFVYIDRRQLLCSNCFQQRQTSTTSISTNNDDNQQISSLKYKSLTFSIQNHSQTSSIEQQKTTSNNDNNNVIQIIEIPPISQTTTSDKHHQENGRHRRIKLTLKDVETGHCCNYYIGGSETATGHVDDGQNKSLGNNETKPKGKDNGIKTLNTNNEQISGNKLMYISEVDINYDPDFHIHIGDRLRKVNDISMDNRSLDDIKNIFQKSEEQLLRLFVEHNPNHEKKSTMNTTRTAMAITTNTKDVANTNCNGMLASNVDRPSDSTVNNKKDDIRHCVTIVINNSSNAAKNNNNLTTTNYDRKNDSCAKLNYQEVHPKNLCLNNVCSTSTPSTTSTTTTINVDEHDATSNSSSTSPNLTCHSTRSLDKRYRHRERSSSLSRLLESINLNSENNHHHHHQFTNDNCDNATSTTAMPLNQCSCSTNVHLNSYLPYFTTASSRNNNGFPSSSKLNNSLSRTKSFRVEPKSYRIFRASDLVKGALLGKGFYGEVFEVTDKITKEKMVMKELYHNDREAEANFVREVSILKSLNHKNVLHFIGILYRGRKLNLITEYITGGTLRQMIQDESRPIYWPERISWAKDIASGVNYLHSMNLIHRDLNSQNCLVRDDGTVVVADFGLSKITCANDDYNTSNSNDNLGTNNNNNSEQQETFTDKQIQKLNRRRDRRKRYTIVGHPFWMAPEMMLRDKYDERVDIYSFGIILLEIIGSVNADPDVLKRNGDFSVDKKYFFDNYVKKSCPEVFWRIAFLCTELNPDSRPSSQVLERWFQLFTQNYHSSSDVLHSEKESMVRRAILEDLFKEVTNYNNGLEQSQPTNQPQQRQTTTKTASVSVFSI